MKEYLNYIKKLVKQIINEPGEPPLHPDQIYRYNSRGKDFYEFMYDFGSQTELNKEDYIRRAKSLNVINKEKLKALTEGRMFVIDNEVSQALYRTDNDIHKRPLPFDNFFINCSFDIEDGSRIEGIQIYNPTRKNPFGPFISFWIKSKNTTANMQYALWENFTKNPPTKKELDIDKQLRQAQMITDPYGISNSELERIENEKVGFDALNSKLMKTYVCNFLDFLNNPEVELVKVNRTKEQNLKRIKKGKHPIPKQLFIKVNGKLKITLNKLKEGSNSELSHRFWVRGHFRTLRSDSWKNPGTKIWITPFIKGKGILVEKVYNMKSGGSNDGRNEFLCE